MNEFVLPGLVKRRAETAGELEKAQARVQQLYADLASLDAVIRQFDPSYPVEAIQARQRRDAAGDEFAALGRAALDMLRKADWAARHDRDGRAHDDGARAGYGGSGRPDWHDHGRARALRHQRAQGAARVVQRAGKSVLWGLVAE